MATTTSRSDADRSTAELIKDLSEQISHLVRDEMRLAQAEMREKAKHVGLGIGMFGAAGLIAFFGLASLVAGGIVALALVLDTWAAALIVGGVLLLIASGLVLVGKSEVGHASPKPERAVVNVKRDIEELKEIRR